MPTSDFCDSSPAVAFHQACIDSSSGRDLACGLPSARPAIVLESLLNAVELPDAIQRLLAIGKIDALIKMWNLRLNVSQHAASQCGPFIK